MGIWRRLRAARRGKAEWLDVLDRHCGVGLWDAVLHDGDAMHPQSRWTWSAEFRRLCGFTNEAGFPNLVQSWSDRLHPDDVEPTFAAFGAALKTGGPYDTTYRLRMKDDAYRWFRATGGVIQDRQGIARRACGSLVDIHVMKQAHETDQRRHAAIDSHTHDFGTSIAGVMATLSRSATAMRTAATEMSRTAENTEVTATATAADVEIVGRHLSSVATSIEQLSASIREISEQAMRAAGIARQATQRAGTAGAKVSSLSEAVDNIGHVVRLISSIAGQTDLLALNATIEAARAGEAGKGFAVVAGEVKALANQTAKATDEIGGQIATIRGATLEAVSAVREVSAEIEDLNAVASVIAAAVEQQATATREINGSVHKAAGVAQQTVSSMQEVSQVAVDSETASETMQTTSAEVSTTASTLEAEVTNFLAAIASVDQDDRSILRASPWERRDCSHTDDRPARDLPR